MSESSDKIKNNATSTEKRSVLNTLKPKKDQQTHKIHAILTKGPK